MFDFCIVEIHKRKIMHLRIFQAKCASSLFDTKKKTVEVDLVLSSHELN